jgi:hypothetical protein
VLRGAYIARVCLICCRCNTDTIPVSGVAYSSGKVLNFSHACSPVSSTLSTLRFTKLLIN